MTTQRLLFFAKPCLGLAAAILVLGSPLAAATIQLTDRSQLDRSDLLVAFPAQDGLALDSPYVNTSTSNQLTAAVNGGDRFIVLLQSVSFPGNFPLGTALLYNDAGGADVLRFAEPISEFGIEVQSNVAGPNTYAVAVLSGSSLRLSFLIDEEPASTTFIGFRGDGADSFDSVIIASLDNDFVLGPPSISSPAASAVPEPWLGFLPAAAVLLCCRYTRPRKLARL